MTSPATTPLDGLNASAVHTAESLLLGCCRSLRWARRLAAHRPYPDVEALLAAADEAGYDLEAMDLHEALAGEPAPHPLGEPRLGTLAAHTALRAAQAAYERKFGHAFVVCLDGCGPRERLDHTLAALRERLGNEPEEEWVVAADELRRLARARLTRLTATGSP
ncbi:2-oxo-4-hydroxy-4-carboxy-5-ureidoimidazoline decarboxylase [Streptomyces axinellae]|uniref:2-oxo-4-hydroxy-4-carboxy-5-ureidoimidazoline decarboxylase n=1 Tax=Streptomyces axinellae TaxID=552788 RepID=A0ABP6D7F6_9ACTN